MNDRNITVNITSGSIIRTILFLLLMTVLWFLRDIVLIVLTAVVIASSMEPGVRVLMRRAKISRVFAVTSIYALTGIVFFGTLVFFIPPLLNDASTFLSRLPSALTSFNISDVTHGLLPWGNVSDTISSSDLLRNISTTIANTTGGVFTTLSAIFGGLYSFVLIVVFAIYFSVQETGVEDFLRIVTPVGKEAYVLHLWKRSQEKIGKWMQGQLVLAALVSILLYLGLVILGVPNALLLAAIAAVFELIPVFGQFMAAIPAIVVAFGSGGTTLALLVAGLYLIVQQFEAHLIYPLVVKKIVGVPPLLVILSLIVGLKMVGFLGVLLSVPIAGAIQEYVSDISREKARVLAQRGLTTE